MVHTRFGAKIGLGLRQITPVFMRKYFAKSSIKNIKSEFEDLKTIEADLEAKYESLNIEQLTQDLRDYFTDLLSIEESIDAAATDADSLEFGALEAHKKLIHELHSAFSGNPMMKEYVKVISQQMMDKISPLRQKLSQVNDEVRRGTIGREMLKDFDIRELFMLYFQIKSAINRLAKSKGKAVSKEHKIISEIKDLIAKANKVQDPKQLTPIFNHVKKNIDEYLEGIMNATNDWFFIERMLLELRNRLGKKEDSVIGFIQKLKGEQFPESELKQIDENFKSKLDLLIKEDFSKEYQKTRALVAVSNDIVNIEDKLRRAS